MGYDIMANPFAQTQDHPEWKTNELILPRELREKAGVSVLDSDVADIFGAGQQGGGAKGAPFFIQNYGSPNAAFYPQDNSDPQPWSVLNVGHPFPESQASFASLNAAQAAQGPQVAQQVQEGDAPAVQVRQTAQAVQVPQAAEQEPEYAAFPAPAVQTAQHAQVVQRAQQAQVAQQGGYPQHYFTNNGKY